MQLEALADMKHKLKANATRLAATLMVLHILHRQFIQIKETRIL